MSRTTSIKALEEMYFYAVRESSSKHFAQLVITGATAVTTRQKAAFATGATALVVFPKYGMSATGSTTITIGGEDFVFTAGSAPNLGVVASSITGNTSTISVSGGEAGDIVEVYELPTWSSPNEVNWIDSLSGAAVPGNRNVMLRGSVDHKKRVFNVEKTLSVEQRFSAGNANLLEFSGNDYTLIGERQDDDGGVTTETLLIFGAYHDAGLPSESVGDNDSTISLDISYEDMVWVDGDANG